MNISESKVATTKRTMLFQLGCIALFTLAACGLSERGWDGKYASKVCEEQIRCDDEFDTTFSDGMCRAADNQGPAERDSRCKFEKSTGRECLKAEWECGEDGFALAPVACYEVWICPELN